MRLPAKIDITRSLALEFEQAHWFLYKNKKKRK